MGTDDTARRLAAEIVRSETCRYEVVGFVDDYYPAAAETMPVLGRREDILQVISDYEVDEVIVSEPRNWQKRFLEKMLSNGHKDLQVRVVPSVYEAMLGMLPLETVDDIPLVDLGRRRCAGWYRHAKQVLDKAAALAGLVVTSPILLLALAAVKLTSRGPAIYRQERTGRGGVPFTLYKIRTMVEDAESGTGPTLSTRKDSRVTPIGRLLRASKIDELPQLVNVLKGQMSLVGPRPERPCFVSEFERRIPCYKERHRVCPGITGFAQVYGDYATSPDMKLRYDLMYVYNQSLWLDIKAAVLTVKAIVREVVPARGEKRSFTPRAKVARPASCRTLKIRRSDGKDPASNNTMAVYLGRHRMRVC